MKLTFNSIQENFRDHIIDSHISSDHKTEPLTNVKLLVKDQIKFKSNTVYIGTCDFIIKNKLILNNTNLILLCDTSTHYIVNNFENSSYILLSNNVELFDVFNKVNELFTYELKLTTLRSHSNLYHIAEQISEFMKNPIIIIDKNYRVKAYSDIKELSDKVWLENISKGFCSYEFITFVNEMKEISASPNNPTPFDLFCSFSPFQRWVTKIYLHGKLKGYILVIVENDLLDDEQKKLLLDSSKIISTWFEANSQQYNPANTNHKQLLLDLLDDTSNNPTILKEKIKIYPTNFKKNFIILVFNLKEASYQEFVEGSISREITTLFNRSHIFYEDNIVLLYDFNSDHFTENSKMTELTNFIKKSHISVGISNTFEDLTHFKKYYIEAKKVLWIKEDLQLSEQIIHYKHVGFYAFLRDLSTENLDLDIYLHPTLNILTQYDLTNNTNFYETLYIYLKNQLNTVATGKELFIHRNTVKYRIDKIIKLTDTDFNNEYELFNLLFSYVVKTWKP